MKKLSTILILVAIMIMIAGCGKKAEFEHIIKNSDEAAWHRYDSDNLIGISATVVVDDYSFMYVFDKDRCLFTEADIKNAFAGDMIAGLDCHTTKRAVPSDVAYYEKDNEIYLLFEYSTGTDMEIIDGFSIYISEDEWITAANTKSNIYLDYYIVSSRTDADERHPYNEVSGADWTQIWNKDESGVWSEPRNRGYFLSDMPME